MTIDNELIDNLLKDYKPEDIMGENGLLKQLTKQLLERAMAAELTDHVGYEKHDTAGHKSGNSRNGKSAKTLKGSFGTMPLEIPRDRNGDLRATDHRETSDALHRLRSKHHFAVRARLINTRDPTTSGRDLPRGSFAGVDLERDGRSD
jgi:hypothetical protein